MAKTPLNRKPNALSKNSENNVERVFIFDTTYKVGKPTSNSNVDAKKTIEILEKAFGYKNMEKKNGKKKN